MHYSLSLILLVYNEADLIRGAYESATRAICKAGIDDYEIIIVVSFAPDGTHDGTPDVVRQITEEDSRVRMLITEKQIGLGYDYRKGVMNATKEYVMSLPGAGHIVEDSVVRILGHVGQLRRDEIINCFTINPEVRPLLARINSRSFVFLYNFLFGLKLKYYNGVCIFPIDLLLRVPMRDDKNTYMAEILIYLLKSGIRYVEIPQEVNPTTSAKFGKTFRLKNLLPRLKAIALIFWRIHFKRERIGAL